LADPNVVDPIHQFAVTEIIPFGDTGLGITNASLFMIVTTAVISAYLILSTRRRALVPNRFQLVSEMLYEFVANMVLNSSGKDGKVFFPFVFSLFMFILTANMLGMIPFFFTVTSQIIVTFALALLVMVVVVVVGFVRNGPKFLKVFVPSGVPVYILPIVVPVEVVSFLSRPISLSVRLFANMLAGHITLKVFAGFVVTLSSLGFLGWMGALLPLAMTVGITALEFLVSALQAYVFALLTATYLHDALHPSH